MMTSSSYFSRSSASSRWILVRAVSAASRASFSRWFVFFDSSTSTSRRVLADSRSWVVSSKASKRMLEEGKRERGEGEEEGAYQLAHASPPTRFRLGDGACQRWRGRVPQPPFGCECPPTATPKICGSECRTLIDK